MISGLAEAILWSSLAPALLSAASGPVAPSDLDSLLGSLTREPPQSVAFVEAYSSPLLEGELVVAGRLEFLGARKLSRVVTAPYEERTDIDGNDVLIQREGQPARQFSLRRSPELGGLLTAFSALLEGDRGALEREFELQAVIAGEAWQLILTPRGAKSRLRIAGMRVRGVGNTPTCIVVLKGDGVAASEILLGQAAVAGLVQQRARHCGELP
jgi:hypothetical protein